MDNNSKDVAFLAPLPKYLPYPYQKRPIVNSIETNKIKSIKNVRAKTAPGSKNNSPVVVDKIETFEDENDEKRKKIST
jgi:hypothetical protein